MKFEPCVEAIQILGGRYTHGAHVKEPWQHLNIKCQDISPEASKWRLASIMTSIVKEKLRTSPLRPSIFKVARSSALVGPIFRRAIGEPISTAALSHAAMT